MQVLAPSSDVTCSKTLASSVSGPRLIICLSSSIICALMKFCFSSKFSIYSLIVSIWPKGAATFSSNRTTCLYSATCNLANCFCSYSISDSSSSNSASFISRSVFNSWNSTILSVFSITQSLI